MASSNSEIRVAVAHGPGAGKFLAVALLDALQSGVPLVAVQASRTGASAHRLGVDFVFYQEDAAREEVIRAGLTRYGRVESAEILRRPARMQYPPYPAADALFAAVRSGEAVSELHWQYLPEADPSGVLSLTMRSDHRFQIDCGPRRPEG